MARQKSENHQAKASLRDRQSAQGFGFHRRLVSANCNDTLGGVKKNLPLTGQDVKPIQRPQGFGLGLGMGLGFALAHEHEQSLRL